MISFGHYSELATIVKCSNVVLHFGFTLSSLHHKSVCRPAASSLWNKTPDTLSPFLSRTMGLDLEKLILIPTLSWRPATEQQNYIICKELTRNPEVTRLVRKQQKTACKFPLQCILWHLRSLLHPWPLSTKSIHIHSTPGLDPLTGFQYG